MKRSKGYAGIQRVSRQSNEIGVEGDEEIEGLCSRQSCGRYHPTYSRSQAVKRSKGYAVTQFPGKSTTHAAVASGEEIEGLCSVVDPDSKATSWQRSQAVKRSKGYAVPWLTRQWQHLQGRKR